MGLEALAVSSFLFHDLKVVAISCILFIVTSLPAALPSVGGRQAKARGNNLVAIKQTRASPDETAFNFLLRILKELILSALLFILQKNNFLI